MLSFILNKEAPLPLFAILFPIPLLATFSSIFMGILNASGQHRQAMTGPGYGALLSIPFALIVPVSAYSLAYSLLGFEFGRFCGLGFHAKRLVKTYHQTHKKIPAR